MEIHLDNQTSIVFYFWWVRQFNVVYIFGCRKYLDRTSLWFSLELLTQRTMIKFRPVTRKLSFIGNNTHTNANGSTTHKANTEISIQAFTSTTPFSMFFFSECLVCVCVFCLCIPILWSFFVFLGKKLVLLKLINRCVIST